MKRLFHLLGAFHHGLLLLAEVVHGLLNFRIVLLLRGLIEIKV